MALEKSFVLTLAPVGAVLIATTLAAGAAQQGLAGALTFHASFDKGADADFALGDKRIYTAPSYKNLDAAKPGIQNPDATAAAAKGRFGAALEFKAKNTTAIYFPAEKNIDYQKTDWNGSVSFWLSLNPDEDLSGFSDPIQITDKDYNNAAMWVDFTNDKPRPFRLGVFGNLQDWNPNKVRGQDNPEFQRHLVTVKTPPFQRGTWTHVVFTFSGLNRPSPGVARLYLNGKLQGSTEPIPEPFTWDIAQAKIRVGLNYVGLLDDLSIFNRALTEVEIQTLHGLAAGVSSVKR